MKRSLVASLSLAVLGFHAPAVADDCRVEHAVYAEGETGLELRFRPGSGENTPVSHKFEVRAVKAGLTLDGHVMYDEEIARPVGMAMNNCPEGDVTGADLNACIVWQGIVYAVDGQGKVDLLPPEGAEAPKTLLLPGFGAAFKMSAVGDKLEAMPWDGFSFKECAP
ncbi:hypothetical protein NBH20_14470 [Rhizobium sp. S153]|uniref:Uncharacterized protein n=1 Tax=Ciceribacter sichuanensis TaxID=2949647 RepID=A0ABT0VAY9_9HYPH|nr:hypothetical protein [Ciceribacter sp. S153]MCM2402371.1 hypothetical protein [Ciceribacter sp. S153]